MKTTLRLLSALVLLCMCCSSGMAKSEDGSGDPVATKKDRYKENQANKRNELSLLVSELETTSETSAAESSCGPEGKQKNFKNKTGKRQRRRMASGKLKEIARLAGELPTSETVPLKQQLVQAYKDIASACTLDELETQRIFCREIHPVLVRNGWIPNTPFQQSGAYRKIVRRRHYLKRMSGEHNE